MPSAVDPITVLGLAAALLTSVAFIPQTIRNFRTRDTSGLSVPSFACFSVGVLLWLLYGLMIQSLPVIAANCFTLAVCALNLWQIWAYGRRVDERG